MAIISIQSPLFRSVILVTSIFATACAADRMDLANTDAALEKEIGAGRYGVLTSQELAIFAAGQVVQQDVIDMLQEYIHAEMATGKPQGVVLCQIRDAFKRAAHPGLSKMDLIVLVGCGVVVAFAAYSAMYFGEKLFEAPVKLSVPDASGSDFICHHSEESTTFAEDEELDLDVN